MQIRTCPARPSDVGIIASFDEFNGDRWREAEAGTCFVAIHQGQVIAYASYEPRGLLGGNGEAAPIEFGPVWLLYVGGKQPYDLSRCGRSSPMELQGGADLKRIQRLLGPRQAAAASSAKRRSP